ncbi:SusC/RagA family TonB-linked outer membrane protein [Parasegetibacter sp. NRK P23]|uniref:SusC/RagA family TonB-linked outer membrane protein n=1 Tax=Parasegetibacter sp. NRK P23 TaxID=2942999 RepID=UPI002042E528|nr:SusC/RagA family TonB-linked outer membrane protein [Parasegetibacter sp. NRK P23]MCM5530416.1 SusC/RagA family TonB-linked outer membrane protein [Parasegetibacter sp. NRK P23]
MRKVRGGVVSLTCLFFLLACIHPLMAQTRKISGIVQDGKTNAPLEGATIQVKGTEVSTTSLSGGSFSLNVPEGKNQLVVSYVGFKTQTFSLKAGEATITVRLEDAGSSQMSDVVVVGYQKQSLRKTTSAVQLVSGKEIENMPAPSFDQMLQGRVAGVNIQNFTGEPGVRNTFTVRGNTTIVTDLNSGVDEARTMSTPLYVIDGIPMSVTDLEGIGSTGTNFLAGINTNDIESVVVQKDAAATAVWGSRGANGVIVIKTKRGRSGKPQLRFSYYTGLTQKPKLLPTLGGVDERRAKLALFNEYGTFAQQANIPQILSDSLNPYFNNATDWQEMFYQNGNVNNADLNLSSGNDQVNYRLGVNFYDEAGIVRNTGFKRFSIRGNFDFKVSPKLDVNLNISASRMDRKRGLGRGRNDVLPINLGQMPSSLYMVSEEQKAFYYGQFDDIKDKNQSDLLSLYLQGNYDIAKGFEYSFQGSVSKTTDRRDRFQPTYITGDRSFAESNNGNFESYYLANVLTYAKTFGEKHNLGLVGTQSFQFDTRSGSTVGGYNVPDDNIQVVSGIPQQDLYGSSYIQKAGLLSAMGQVSYDYDQKYILNLSWRADASSRFGSSTKWGYFPAVSAAYILSDESFMQNISWLNMLKLRGSYGLSGTMPDDFYAPFNVWNLSQGTYNGTVIATPSFTKPITQPDLTWNKSKQTNIGVDVALLENRISFSADIYRRYTSNPILQFPFPFFTGYTSVTYNAPVKLLNEGLDLSLTSRNLNKKSAVQWNTIVNLNLNENRIAELPNGNRSFFLDSYGYNQSLVFSVGGPTYGWAQMLYRGVYNRLDEIPVNPVTGQKLSYFKTYNPVLPGYPIWVDVNKDWDVWSDEDRGEQYGDLVPTGNPNPKLTGGFTNEFTYKNFYFSVLCTFTLGRDIINNFDANQFANVWNYSGNTLADFGNTRLPDLTGRNYWTPTGAAKDPAYSANFPSLSPYGGHFYEFLPFSTMWNEDGSYLKIRNISMGYTLPRSFIDRLKLKNARVYSIIDNIYAFQRSNVPDAELVSPQGEYRGGAYPLPRKYTLGLEVTF